MEKRYQKSNLLILGASGGVAQALLLLLEKYRFLFDNVVLLDKKESVLHNKYINHKKLDYIFLKYDLKEGIDNILKQTKKTYNITDVLDLTDCETLPLLESANSFGLNYLNCSVNSDNSSMVGLAENLKTYTLRYKNATHVLALGMNPGIVNHLLVRGVMEHGVPLEYVEIEYDSAYPTRGFVNKPFITWSKTQFLNESVRDPSGYCGEHGTYLELDVPAIKNLCDTDIFLKPIKELKNYPKGMVVPHDEIVTMSRSMEIPGKFVYAIHPESLEKLQTLTHMQEKVTEDDLEYLDNIEVPLNGSDCIGVWLIYADKRVCYYIDLKHQDVVGTNATLFLVALGVIAGLVDFVHNPLLERGVLTPIDLNTKVFLDVVSNHVAFAKIVKK